MKAVIYPVPMESHAMVISLLVNKLGGTVELTSGDAAKIGTLNLQMYMDEKATIHLKILSDEEYALICAPAANV